MCSFSYDHEFKIQKARENARRTEKEKEAERNDSLMHEFLIRNKFIIKLSNISVRYTNIVK